MSFRTNLLASLGGRILYAGVGILIVPVYVHLLGIEAYGLIGFISSVLATATILNFGLPDSLSRELANPSAEGRAPEEIRDLARSFEVPGWGLAAALGLAAFAAAEWVASEWIRSDRLPRESIRFAVAGTGLVIAFQLPVAIYNAGLAGLQRQVLLNSVQVVLTLLRHLGAAAILWFVSDSIEAFVVWLVIVTALNALVTKTYLWASLPRAAARPRFRPYVWRRVWRLTAGIGAVSFAAALIQQVDKLVLSRVLPLDEFGYYALATVLASNLALLPYPVYAAAFPRLVQLTKPSEAAALRSTFRKSSRLIAVLVLPIAIPIAFFPKEVIALWTGDPILAAKAAAIVTVLILAAVFKSLASMPTALALAFGRTYPLMVLQVIGLIALVPTTYALAAVFGPAGGAAAVLLFRVTVLVILAPAIVRMLLPGIWRLWLLGDVGLPLVVSVALVTAFRAALPEITQPLAILAALGGISSLVLAANIMTADWLRAFIVNRAMLFG